MTQILIATGHGTPGLFHDEAELAQALGNVGIQATVKHWQNIEPDGTPILIRTIWDYTQHPERFASWLDALDDTDTPCFNSTAILRWNMDKRYLVEMEARGHAIVPTLVLDDYSPEAALEAAAVQAWPDVICKPVVGGGAEGLTRIKDGHIQAFDTAGNTWAPDAAKLVGPCLLQPFMPSILHGEWSLFFFDGEFSHAILKKPGPNDIRVQEEHGGTTTSASPPPEVLEPATAMAQEVPSLYVRVDGVMADEFRLMELEMIEPELYFRYAPGSLQRFANAVSAAVRA